MFLAQATALVDKPAETLALGGALYVVLKILENVVIRLLPVKKHTRCNVSGEQAGKLEEHIEAQNAIARATERSAAAQESTAQTLDAVSDCLKELKEGNRRIELGQATHAAEMRRGGGGP